MARVIPIDIIKGISGKYGKDAGFYFATNTSSGKIRISQLPKPSHRPPTEKQKTQRSKFAARHAAVTAWLNANKPSELNGPKGTKAYQHVQRLKRKLRLSLINQVLLKYMDGDNIIRLPETKERRNRNLHTPQKPYFLAIIQFVLFIAKTLKTHQTFLYPPLNPATVRSYPAEHRRCGTRWPPIRGNRIGKKEINDRFVGDLFPQKTTWGLKVYYCLDLCPRQKNPADSAA